jgi:iron complex transport system substrate-binding protein
VSGRHTTGRQIAIALALAVAVAGCGRVRGDATAATSGVAGGDPIGNVTKGCVERFDERVDYFPDKVRVEDAGNFSVAYHQSYKVVTVRETFPGGPSERYVLVQCGAPKPSLEGDLAGAPIVQVPIASLFSSSTTHLPLLVDLDRVQVLAGVAKFASIVSPPVVERIGAGAIVEFAPLGVIDVERVVARRPTMLMTAGSDSSSFAAIRAAGIPVVANAEWLEPTSLGRAEWVKYMALFLNEERGATRAFDRVKSRYRELLQRTSAIPESARPLVMTGRATRGTFVIAGGRSYVARLIADAGARYVWTDNPSTGNAAVDLEAQIRRASKAAFWINGGGWANRAAMLADEPRYDVFDAFRSGQVWVYERLQNAAGGNDYWSRSVTRPDLLLADLIKIFHPGLVPEHTFTWYLQVPSK